MRWIVHVDMDAYYVSCEIRDRPELAEAPVIVGRYPTGPSSRGVVLSASYPARAKGVRSALPVGLAAARCPEATWIAPDFPKYERIAEEIRALLREKSQRVVPLSIDEAAMEVDRSTPAEVAAWAEAVRSEIRERLRLPSSFGASPYAIVAKVATDQAKPAGVRVIPPEETAAFLAPLSVGALPGIGPKTEERLRGIGIATVAALAAAEVATLRPILGQGSAAWRSLARGTPGPGFAELPPEAGPVQRSVDRTLEQDTDDPGALVALLGEMATDLAGELDRSGHRYQAVVVRLRWSDFSQLQKGRKLPAPAQGADTLRREATKLATALLERERQGQQRPVRRVSLAVGELTMRSPAQRPLDAFVPG
jgi:nucleotidyltransferase/DNA polymerase involved in DNA repair